MQNGDRLPVAPGLPACGLERVEVLIVVGIAAHPAVGEGHDEEINDTVGTLGAADVLDCLVQVEGREERCWQHVFDCGAGVRQKCGRAGKNLDEILAGATAPAPSWAASSQAVSGAISTVA